MLYAITGQERGTEVCCTWVEVLRAPVRSDDSKEWFLPKRLLHGPSNGYVGEWMSSTLMKTVFGRRYKRSRGGDQFTAAEM